MIERILQFKIFGPTVKQHLGQSGGADQQTSQRPDEHPRLLHLVRQVQRGSQVGPRPREVLRHQDRAEGPRGRHGQPHEDEQHQENSGRKSGSGLEMIFGSAAEGLEPMIFLQRSLDCWSISFVKFGYMIPRV